VRAYLAFAPAQWLLGEQMLVVARRPTHEGTRRPHLGRRGLKLFTPARRDGSNIGAPRV
jgi:hypothetical protein